MARVEDLIDEIPDPELRDQIAREVKELKSTKRFGLVYEDHVPETVSLFGLPVRSGSIVQKRTEPDDQGRYEVTALVGEAALIVPVGSEEPVEQVPVRDLLTVKRFEEPIYPGLTPVGEVRRGPEDRPTHTVINGENYHALQLLAYTHAGKVDVIYIDPPYNTGASDWTYNNRYVDANDRFRHSRWLAMMERRLKLAEKLLNPEGSALIVTIDEKEVLRLGLLLEQVFPTAQIQMVTIVINPKGTGRYNEFSRVEEYAYFVTVGEIHLQAGRSDMLTSRDYREETHVRWRGLARTGRKGLRSNNPGSWYPIFVNDDDLTVHSIGDAIDFGVEESTVAAPPGTFVVWPPTSGTDQYSWSVVPATLRDIWSRGGFKTGRMDRERGSFPFYYLSSGAFEKIDSGAIEVVGRGDQNELLVEYRRGARAPDPRSVWNQVAHDAGSHGTDLVKRFIPGRRFPFPKSLYAVEDAIRFFVQDNKEAVVLDFFAGSGTTAHAVMRLNRQDGGERLSLMVTNNEVSEREAKDLHSSGLYRGDDEWEQRGIFEWITGPRVQAAVVGKTPSGEAVEGEYKFYDVFPYADGFDENVAFFRMEYLEPDLVELNRQYEAIAPLLWMTAGSVGHWEPWDGKSAWSAPKDSTYAVLFDESEAAVFGAYVESRSDEITHVWIVTDSHSAYLDLQAQLPPGVEAGQLYRDYLRNFVVNAPGATR